jgi:hypothetical protein
MPPYAMASAGNRSEGGNRLARGHARTAALAWALWAPLLAAQPSLRIGFVDQSLPAATTPRNAAALAFAGQQGTVSRIRLQPDGSWIDADGAACAPEQFDVVWFHEADVAGRANPGEAAAVDLGAYLRGGGCALLSGAAGQLVHLAGFETTPPRILEPTDAPYVSGLRVTPEHRSHAVFAGLDPSRDILLTSKGCIALADYYGTAGPHGILLAEGNASVGERPLVEYRCGAGRAVFVGWRLADFSTATDPHRANLERLFANLLRYLAAANGNRARPLRGEGKVSYRRVLGVPFLAGAAPGPIRVVGEGFPTLVLLRPDAGGDRSHRAGPSLFVEEVPFAGAEATVTALAATLCLRASPASDFVADLEARQAALDQADRTLGEGLRVITPAVTFTKAPLAPNATPDTDQSVLLGRSFYMAPGEGLGGASQPYEPIEDGGFLIRNGNRRLNRPIVQGQNRVVTGDRPLLRLETVAGSGCYAEERVFPLWPRPDAARGNVTPCMGTLRLGVPGADGKPLWLDDAAEVQTVFRPGYTEYTIAGPAGAWNGRLSVAPTLGGHGLVCRLGFDRDMPLVWQFGGICWQASEPSANRVDIAGRQARITEACLPNGLVLAGWDGEGAGRVIDAPHGQSAEFATAAPRRTYHIVAAWGVTTVDEARVTATLARLDTPTASQWPAARDHLKQAWRETYITPALDPQRRLDSWLRDPAAKLQETVDWWDRRRAEFQVRTPDPHLNALANWARCTSEYHRQGPGLVLGAQIWQMYAHISVGWSGKLWGGDYQAIEECLRFYAAMQDESGFIRWIAPSLVAFPAENNTPYWVDQVWHYYAWTGDRQFLHDLWPAVRKACTWMQTVNDPDGDGLFRGAYEYWNCDSNGKGPKAAASTATAWAMLDRAARIAAALGDDAAAKEYGDLAAKTREAVFRELWREDAGRLGSVGACGLWQGHPQTWEEYLAANAGLLSPAQGRSALRWLAGHYGFEPNPGVKLLACSDWWPIRWSVQWVPTGDTCLAALAGMRAGDTDLWWPYLKTVVGSAFLSEFPGISMGISNLGAGGGDREDVDSVDPHLQVVLRGLFGIEPALHEGRLAITPSFPSDWNEASLRQPGLQVSWRREGQRQVLRLVTDRPLAKTVRAAPDGPEVVTPAEKDSTVTIESAATALPVMVPARPTILAEQQPPPSPKPLAEDEIRHLVLVDLAAACNQSTEEFCATPYVFDHADGPSPLTSWWGNPAWRTPPAPRLVQSPQGVRFLTAGQALAPADPGRKVLLGLSSWRPYPLPAGVRIPIGIPCRRLWLLLAAYVHPMKNYLTNGEIVLVYADGSREVTPLVPPHNLDAYFQHFSRQGVAVPYGELAPLGGGWSFVPGQIAQAHADAIELPCRPEAAIEAIEVRATCSEGILAVAGLTLQAQ